jgi:hypothetical protein
MVKNSNSKKKSKLSQQEKKKPYYYFIAKNFSLILEVKVSLSFGPYCFSN